MNHKEEPDNTTLIALLNRWSADMSKENYAKVRKELIEGSSFLMLPSGNMETDSGEWTALSKPSTLKLGSLWYKQ
jgi:hypothetical protein